LEQECNRRANILSGSEARTQLLGPADAVLARDTLRGARSAISSVRARVKPSYCALRERLARQQNSAAPLAIVRMRCRRPHCAKSAPTSGLRLASWLIKTSFRGLITRRVSGTTLPRSIAAASQSRLLLIRQATRPARKPSTAVPPCNTAARRYIAGKYRRYISLPASRAAGCCTNEI